MVSLTAEERYVELIPPLSNIDSKGKQLLLNQTERVLDRHADIQNDQRRRAIRLFQGYLAGIGLFATSLPFAFSFFGSLQFIPNPHPIRIIVGSALLMLGMYLLISPVTLLYDLPIVTAEILTPEPIDRSPIRAIISNLVSTAPTRSAGGGEIRAVSIGYRLNSMMASYSNSSLDGRLLADRIQRIESNELVINRNMELLQHIFSRISAAVEFFGIGFILFVIGIFLTVNLP